MENGGGVMLLLQHTRTMPNMYWRIVQITFVRSKKVEKSYIKDCT